MRRGHADSKQMPPRYSSSFTRGRKFSAIAAGLLLSVASALAQEAGIPIWPGVPPGSETWTQREVEYLNPRTGEKMVRNVVTPALTPFLPDPGKATGTGVVVCPGGAFLFLSWDSEGTEVAKWLAARGVAAFVLKYRLIPTPAPEPEFQKTLAGLFAGIAAASHDGNIERLLDRTDPGNVRSLAAADGKQALRVVRARAKEWGLSPDRIGIMGFSAGGFVTMDAVLDHDPQSRPDFAAPIYGGDINGRTIPADAPPLFILVANDDALMAAGSVKLYTDWKATGRSVELHVFSKGGHGFGMTKHGLPVDHWIDLFDGWLGVQGFLASKR